MKFIHYFSLALLVAMGTLTSARGDTNINPALLYYQAFLLEPHLSDADHDYLFTNVWQGRVLPERFGTLMANNYGNYLQLLQRAVEQKQPCDWGIDLSRGPATLLPHLSPCKRAAQTLRLHAMWELQQGDEAAARDDLVAGLTVGRNSAPEGFLIGVLVQIADESIVYSTVAENFSKFSPDTLQQLEAGFESAPARTTMAAGVAQEQIIHTGWLRNKLQSIQREHPGNDAEVLAAIRDDATLQGFEYFGNDGQRDTNVWNRIAAAAGGTSDGVIGLVRELDPWYARLHKTLLLPQPEFDAQARAFDTELQTAANPLVKILLPYTLTPRHKEFTIQVEAAMVRAAVEYKLHGEAGLNSVMDPAGKGPFTLQRFVFQGEDRGFKLTSPYVPVHIPLTMIFEEKDGPAFNVLGPRAGQPVTP
jgi:hypothetical protein